MRDRTTNTNKKEANRYVNRGINSDEFRYFIDFYDALYPSWVEIRKKYPANEISLDRIDNDKSYTKDNCRWVHYKDQYKNMNDENEISLDNGIVKTIGNTEYVFPENDE